jgi:integrase
MKLTSAAQLPPEKNDLIVFDDTLRGFGLRIRRLSGGRVARNWIIQYRQHGHGRRMIVGSVEKLTAAQARKQATKLLSKVVLGEDPQVAKRERRERDTLSLRSVVSDYLAHKTGVKDGTMRMLRSYLDRPLYLGSLRNLPIDRITRRDVATRLLAVSKDNGIPTAIAFRSALSSLFVWSMQTGLTETNPLVGAVRPKPPASRDRVLSDNELSMIWRGLEDRTDYAAVVRLLICTGARRQEVGSMRWSEISDDVWIIPKERAKTAKALVLPIAPLMREVLDSIPRRVGVDHLFGRKHGFTGWSIGKKALDEKIDLPAWVHHDIRRSVSTGMNNLGIAPHIVETILGHSIGGTHGIYNRANYQREVRAAMALWSDHITAITTGGERKVVAFERAAVASTP